MQAHPCLRSGQVSAYTREHRLFTSHPTLHLTVSSLSRGNLWSSPTEVMQPGLEFSQPAIPPDLILVLKLPSYIKYHFFNDLPIIPQIHFSLLSGPSSLIFWVIQTSGNLPTFFIYESQSFLNFSRFICTFLLLLSNFLCSETNLSCKWLQEVGSQRRHTSSFRMFPFWGKVSKDKPNKGREMKPQSATFTRDWTKHTKTLLSSIKVLRREIFILLSNI